jgi:hypothetical protein
MLARLAAAREGMGVGIAAAPFTKAGLVTVAHAKPLNAAWADLPEGGLRLVGHRALRHVPRVAAVWSLSQEVLGSAAE